MAAPPAHKLALALTIRLLAVPAFRAGARGVAGVNDFDRHPSDSSLVGDLTPEIVERLTVMPVALRIADWHPLTDTREVFEANTTPGALGLLYDALADSMIDAGLKTPLPSTDSPEQFSRTASAFRGSRCAGSQVSITGAVYVLAAKDSAIGSDSELHDAEVNTNPGMILVQLGGRGLYVDVHADVVMALPRLEDNGTPWLTVSEHVSLVITDREGKPLQSALYR